jgi:hypothetical protein
MPESSLSEPQTLSRRRILLGRDGDRLAAEVSLVPVFRGDRVVGVFGQLTDVEEPPPRPGSRRLRPPVLTDGTERRGHGRRQPQRSAPASAASATVRTAAYDGFGVQSAQRSPDCHPESAGSSANSKLNSAWTAGWQ